MLNVVESASSGANTPIQTSEKRCENPGCDVNKLLALVPKRKSTQFVSEPIVMEKPLLVNGYTGVFQVDGGSAKLMDIKNPSGEASNNKAIYRIVPNSHVHVVNYVVVDTDESYLKKITDNDPATMQKMVASQKQSADQMLAKIMSGQGTTCSAATTTVVTATEPAKKPGENLPTPKVGLPINNNSQTNAPLRPLVEAQLGSGPANLATPTETSKQSIHLPVRMHPNLKITAVGSVENATPPLNTSTGTPNPPFIQPVPLANLQSLPPVSLPTLPSAQNISVKHVPPSGGLDVVDKITYDKMQEEINDLRRTVAMLAEAQAKNLQQPTTPTELAGPSRKQKLPRISQPK